MIESEGNLARKFDTGVQELYMQLDQEKYSLGSNTLQQVTEYCFEVCSQQFKY